MSLSKRRLRRAGLRDLFSNAERTEKILDLPLWRKGRLALAKWLRHRCDMSPRLASPEIAAPPEALRRARRALDEFPGCFWTRRPGLPLEGADDVRLVVRRLRQHGDPAAWRAARLIEKCL